MSSKYNVALLIVSDRVSKGQAQDKSGPALIEILNKKEHEGDSIWNVADSKTVPDEKEDIQKAIKSWTDNNLQNLPHLILTSGGTGFSPRDITPEAVAPLLDRQAPGLIIAMMNGGLNKTPLAALSRPVAGIRGSTVIITLPGSPKGATENFEAIMKVLPHALRQARGEELTSHPTISHRGGCSHVKSVATKAPFPSEAVTRRPRSSPYPMISVKEAQAIVLERSGAFLKEPITMGLKEDILGMVLAEEVVSIESVPAYPASVVDGYAVRSIEGAGIYPVASDVSLAGSSSFAQSLPVGFIARISTGAPVPEGANAVVMVEDTELVEASEDEKTELKVKILGSVSEGANIRQIGSDLAKGVVILPKGHVLNTLDLGLLSSAGVLEVKVYKKPRVGILSTGNEVVDLTSQSLNLGQVRDANRPMLLGELRSAGFDAVDLGICPDSASVLEDRVRKALSELDVLVTTGGVSMGEADLMKSLVASTCDLHFGRVAMKPGKPTTFATQSATSSLIFALPGNPVSAAVALQLFVLPALRCLINHPHPLPPHVPVLLNHQINLDSRPEFYRATVSVSKSHSKNTSLVAQGTGSQMSSRLLSMTGANALLVLPPATKDLTFISAETLIPAIMMGPILPSN